MWKTDFDAVEQQTRASLAHLTDKQLRERYTERNNVRVPRGWRRADLIEHEILVAKNKAMAKEVNGD